MFQLSQSNRMVTVLWSNDSLWECRLLLYIIQKVTKPQGLALCSWIIIALLIFKLVISFVYRAIQTTAERKVTTFYRVNKNAAALFTSVVDCITKYIIARQQCRKTHFRGNTQEYCIVVNCIWLNKAKEWHCCVLKTEKSIFLYYRLKKSYQMHLECIVLFQWQ
jgi:hypothetical protein